MFTRLSKLLFILCIFIKTPVAYSQQGSFAFSPQWRALLHYRPTLFKNQSRAHHQEFFLSKDGKHDLLGEYQANLEAFKKDKSYRCRFPARAVVIQHQIDKSSVLDFSQCTDLNDWMESLGYDELSILFAGAYANNPASLFGHTFLKFSKEGRNALLNYVVAFLARTDPRDSAPVYTWKGLTGGYLGFFEIEHYSMSIGLYNNSESRDLWEYKLPLSADQRKLVAYHLWEIIHHTGFAYYFGDENCSYLLLALLEVALPEAQLTSNPPAFVMPIETVKLLQQRLGEVEFRHYRRSLQSIIHRRLRMNNSNFVKDYVRILKQRDLLGYEDNVEMLDLLIDTYHLKNYREKTNLSQTDQEFMYLLLKTRAELDERSTKWEWSVPSRPDQSHSPRRLRTQFDDDKISLELSYGLHRLIDPHAGYEDFSYIDFLILEGSYDYQNKSTRFERFTLVDISSWEPISLSNAALSWQIKAQSLKADPVFQTGSLLNIKGGPGLALMQGPWGSALFAGADLKMVYRDQKTRTLPYLEWQNYYRPNFLKKFSTAFVLRHFYHHDKPATQAHWEGAWHFDTDLTLSVNVDLQKIRLEQNYRKSSLALSYRF